MPLIPGDIVRVHHDTLRNLPVNPPVGIFLGRQDDRGDLIFTGVPMGAPETPGGPPTRDWMAAPASSFTFTETGDAAHCLRIGHRTGFVLPERWRGLELRPRAVVQDYGCWNPHDDLDAVRRYYETQSFMSDPVMPAEPVVIEVGPHQFERVGEPHLLGGVREKCTRCETERPLPHQHRWKQVQMGAVVRYRCDCGAYAPQGGGR